MLLRKNKTVVIQYNTVLFDNKVSVYRVEIEHIDVNGTNTLTD